MPNIKDYQLNIKDYIINVDTFDVSEIRYIKPHMFFKSAFNIGIYHNKRIEDKNDDENNSKGKINYITIKQKIIVKTPIMMVPFDIREILHDDKKYFDKKFFNISFSFNPLSHMHNEIDIKKFFNFVQKIDRSNENTIMEHRSSWKLPKEIKYKTSLWRQSDRYSYYMNALIVHDENVGLIPKICDENAKPMSIDNIKKRCIVSAVIELTDLNFTNKDFRCNWTVLYLRKHNPYSRTQDIFRSACFIDDDGDIIDNNIKTTTSATDTPYAPYTPYTPYTHKTADYTNTRSESMRPTPPPLPSLDLETKINKPPISNDYSMAAKPPSLHELLKAKSLLKPTVTIVKGQLPTVNIATSENSTDNFVDLITPAISTKAEIDESFGSDKSCKSDNSSKSSDKSSTSSKTSKSNKSSDKSTKSSDKSSKSSSNSSKTSKNSKSNKSSSKSSKSPDKANNAASDDRNSRRSSKSSEKSTKYDTNASISSNKSHRSSKTSRSKH